jgi:tRNA-dihydrouridine synthase 3
MCRLGSCHVDMSTGMNLRRTVDGGGGGGNGTIAGTTPSLLLSPDGDDGNGATTTTTTATAATATAKEGGGGGDRTGGGAAAAAIAEMGHRGDSSNVLSKNTQILLRKSKYPFVCKRHFEVRDNKKGAATAAGARGGTTTDATDTPALPPRERKLVDFRNKVYVAPLTTVGNLPFRRVMKMYGADITCGEMALADQLLLGRPSEWALLRRHPCEDVFGVQIAAGHPDQYTRVAEVLANEDGFRVDFVDLNLGCPIDMVCEKGAGASLMLRDKKLRGGLEGMLAVLDCPVTIKMRTGWNEAQPIAHELVPRIQGWGIEGIGAIMVRAGRRGSYALFSDIDCKFLLTCFNVRVRLSRKIHGRSRLQRYSRSANWDYISQVARSQSPDLPQIPVIGNGDIFSYTDYEEKILRQVGDVDGGDDGGGGNKNNLCPAAMLGRGALIKPWLPTEIKERRHWDISAGERLDMLKDFVRFGLEHWGSDQQGVNHTRRFLLEWLSFLHR